MIRPIETNMSLFTLDHKAQQAQKDPDAHTVLSLQQAEAIKKADNQLNTVQKSPETEGDVKIRDKDSEKKKRDQRRRRRDNEAEAGGTDDEFKDGGDGHLDFLA